jgi:purine-nucleoside/S-methyl-5'-thioadenosine phosphorylase / adenosine deaminase
MHEPPGDWIVPDWPAPANVRTLITTRSGGVSTGPFASMNLGKQMEDDIQSLQANRALLRDFLPAEPKWLLQVHGARVTDADSLQQPVEADAAVARNPGSVCTVLVADCLPVLLTDRAGSVVAAAHAGWRGLAAGVLESTVDAMGSASDELLAYLGPAIGPSAFEVGADVRDVFLSRSADATSAFVAHKPGKWLADLFALARQRLREIGVTQIYGGGLCTYSDRRRFFSHRRDKVTGRMAALIWLSD